MKKVTAVTLFQTAAGYRISMVYSEINEKGIILRDNVREDRIIVDADAIAHVEEIELFAKRLIDEEV